MESKILNQTEETILGIERHWLTQLQIALAKFPATEEDRTTLERSVRQLDELFLLVVVGEFNAGKSALINALFGQPLLEMGVTPTTTRIQLLRHGDSLQRLAQDADVDILSVPSPILSEITIVDTPGTNAIYREHEAMTREFIPRSDLVLFVTSVDRPFTESERAFLELIREWGKKIVLVLNKIDILEDPAELEVIEAFIEDNAQSLLGFVPDIFPVSARGALRAKAAKNATALTTSRIEALESYIVRRLDEKERIRLKLRNPLGVGLHLIDRYIQIIDDRTALLQDDFAVLENITRQQTTYEEEMARDFRLRFSDVDRELQVFENRGMAFFDDVMRLGRLFDLMDRSKLEAQYREEVIADIPDTIESRVEEVTVWLVASNQEQWRIVMEHVRRRKDVHTENLLGDLPTAFEMNRDGLIETVSRSAQQALLAYDRKAEAHRIAQSLQRAVANTALVEVGAVGLGTLITVIAGTTALDVTGIVAAGTMAVLGLLVIPSRRRRLKEELRDKIEGVRVNLMTTLTSQFEEEMATSLKEIQTSISPYTRFIRSQQKQWHGTREEMVTIQKWLRRQEAEIEAL
ncbi:MAG: dynamin family protein [Anaerolineae bacterium]|nr:dynamin family protein [Anaerolineae bacterium]